MDTKLKTNVYRLLARREYSAAMLRRKLLVKGFAEEAVEAVLAELSREGSVSDRRFMESYVRYRQSRGYGPLRIRQELALRGIAKEMIEDHLDITDNAWLAEVQRVWQKRFSGQHPVDLKARGQQMRFLQYRGFTEEQIATIFDA